MKVRIMLQIAADDAEPGEAAEEVVSLEKRTDRLEEVGLSLAESKALLAAIQHRVVGLQTEAWMKQRRHCETCGRRLRVKGSYPITFRTLFGDIRLTSQRFDRCRCQGGAGPATASPLKDLLSPHVAPERLYLEARWASLAPYAVTAELLADVLPVEGGLNATTIRAHALGVAERAEAELGEERSCFIEGCPAEWEKLPLPEGRIVVGLDGGYVRDWTEKKTNFEIIVGRSLPEDRADPLPRTCSWL